MSKKFNIKPTLEAFKAIEDKIKDLVTLRVHQELLEGTYLIKNKNKIRKALAKLESTHTKVLLNTYFRKLSFAIPKVPIEGKYDDFQLVLIQNQAALLIVNILLDSGEYEEVTEVISIDPSENEGKTHATYKYLLFSGTPIVKELFYGFETEPGVVYQKSYDGIKLSKPFISLLFDLSSMPFKFSDVMTKELLNKGYSLTKDYKSKKSTNNGEHYLKKRERYHDYASLIMDKASSVDKFYLPMKYDSRSRMYYYFQLVGVRPQGKLWETMFIDSYKSYHLDLCAINHIKHIIYVTLHGRCTLDYALANITDDDLVVASVADPMSATTDKDFGNFLLLNKAAKAIQLADQGLPTNYLFGKDVTNCGLAIAGSSFKSQHMLKLANLLNEDHVYDSHTYMQECYGLQHLSRDDMKKISTPMLHGSSIDSLIKKVQSALVKNGADEYIVASVDRQFINKVNKETFGSEVDNIFAISEWGKKAVNNYRSKLYWTSIDGFKCIHKSSMQHFPLTLYCATASSKNNYLKYKLISNMPLKEQSSGSSLYPRGHVAQGSKKAVTVSKSGLFANITHSLDAVLLRNVVKQVIAHGHVCLLKHDDYIVPASAFEEYVISEALEFFKYLNQDNHYMLSIKDIIDNAQCFNLKLPLFEIGGSYVEDSVNFIMP